MGSKQSSLAKAPSKEESASEQIDGVRGREVIIVEEQEEVKQRSEESLAEMEEISDEDSDSESDEESDDEEEETEEELQERLMILRDAQKLKQLATAFLHPELPVQTHPAAFGRNYFTRPSAVEQEDVEEMEERVRVLEEAAALKKLAVDYAHPEIGVVTSDPTSCARNYFGRASAPEQESKEEAEERALILQDMKELKRAALEYLHPELGVVTSDPAACGRNYFDRPSAPEQEDMEEAEERARVLADAAALKKLAVDYAHPELGVVTSDPTACARNYFDRPSAIEQEDMEEAEERARVLADAAALKKLAVDYAHPEIGVVTSDPTACARNYFDRPSAPQEETIKKSTISKQQVTITKAKVLPTTVPRKDVAMYKKEEESNIVRSPSAVLLFGLGEDDSNF